MIERVTFVLSEVTKVPTQAFTVLIDEIDAENIGVGGIQVSKIKHD